jgi:predicted transcriptional regulator
LTSVTDVNPEPLAPLLELPGVAEAVTASRQAVDKLLGHRVLRRRSSDVSAESLLRGAWASAALAGSPAGLEEVRAGKADDPIAQGALRVSTELATLAGTWTGAQRQALARLHALAATDLLPAERLGRPRPDREVAHRLDTLAEVLARTKAPAVVIAAIVQGEVLSLDAFTPASGVVARAAARLTLIDRGLDPKSLVALEVGHLELAEQEQAALAEYRGGEPAGVVGWIEHCGRAIELGVRESLAICEAIQRG